MDGYRIRRPTADDFAAVVNLLRECEQADFGVSSTTADVFAVNWKELDLDHNVWLVVDDAERLVGMANVRPFPNAARIFARVRVHPNHRDRGIDAELERLVQGRAPDLLSDQPSDRQIVLVQSVGKFDELAPARLAASGYVRVRRFWEMEIHLGDEPRLVTWPSGIRVAFIEPGQEHAFVDATNEAFQDHWGFAPVPFEQVMKYLDRPGAEDRSVSLIAWDGTEVAGCCLNRVSRPDKGYVETLGVRRPWRGRGLGLALLVHSFNEFRRRGLKEAALSVDSESLTGATRLYERAGMHVATYADAFHKVLREASRAAV